MSLLDTCRLTRKDRAFLTALQIAKAPQSEERVRKIVKSVYFRGNQEEENDESSEQVSDEALLDAGREAVTRINFMLHPIGLVIRTGKHPIGGGIFIGLTERKGDSLAALSAAYTSAEVNFLRNLLEKIVEKSSSSASLDGSLPPRHAVQRRPDGMLIAQAENLLKRFVDAEWLEETDDDDICIGIRSVLELQPYLDDIASDT